MTDQQTRLDPHPDPRDDRAADLRDGLHAWATSTEQSEPVHGAPGDPDDPDDRGGSGGGDGSPRRRIDKTLLLVSLLVAVGLALIVRGLFVGVTGDERANLPELVESVIPVPDAVQVLSQTNVVVDLAPGHTGVLVIDGIEIETVNVDEVGSIRVEPGQQVDLPPVTIYEPGNATLTFTPSDDAPIEEFTTGVHRVQVIYWRIDEGPQRARSYTWTFNVV